MSNRRHVAVFTGTRADFGLLRPVVSRLTAEPGLDVGLIVGGTHHDERFGATLDEVQASGLPVSEVLRIPIGDDAAAIAHTTGATTAAVADAFDRKPPALAIVLGDRYEALGFATACLLSRVPLAHIHGGETTHGAVDDAIRHAITQMAELHFVAASAFADRVMQMGARPDSVHVTGAPGLDAIATTLAAGTDSRSIVESRVGDLPDARPIFLLAHHPETRSAQDPAVAIGAILDVLLAIDGSLVLTSAPNADWDSRRIMAELAERRDRVPDRIRFVASFGHRPFVHAMALADVMVGNSSAGVIEAPFVGTPSVTVGGRQSGRPLADTVFQCGTEPHEIAAAVDHALHCPTPAAMRSTVYGDGDASGRIARIVTDFVTAAT